LMAFALVGCRKSDPIQWQGYIEGEFVYIAPALGGTVTELRVQRGDTVASFQPLFTLEHESETRALEQARHQCDEAGARLDDARKGKRPSELDEIAARLAQARSACELSQAEFNRKQKLFNDKVISADEFDVAKNSQRHDQALVDQYSAELATARLGARDDTVRAAEADLRAAQAAVAKAQWNVDQKSRSAPTNGIVQDTFYREGEWVTAGAPVVSLLPPTNIKVRFFIPETELSSFHTGEPLEILIDGQAAPLAASLSYISPQSEFTPPVIYSQENRAKLVYMMEARFTSIPSLVIHPGQPVDVKRARK
jgi:HlyD family secretion protein